MCRPYWPAALLAAVVSRRCRRAVLAALAVDSASDWLWLLPNLQVAASGITGVPLNAVGDGYPVSRITRG